MGFLHNRDRQTGGDSDPQLLGQLGGRVGGFVITTGGGGVGLAFGGGNAIVPPPLVAVVPSWPSQLES